MIFVPCATNIKVAKKIGEENEYTEKSFKMVEEIDRIHEEKENICGN